MSLPQIFNESSKTKKLQTAPGYPEFSTMEPGLPLPSSLCPRLHVSSACSQHCCLWTYLQLSAGLLGNGRGSDVLVYLTEIVFKSSQFTIHRQYKIPSTKIYYAIYVH
jgi:hypothetical protein